MLSEIQVERYSRQIILPEIGGRGQERLLATTVAIIASQPQTPYLLLYLSAAGIGRVTLCTSAVPTDWIAEAMHLNPDCRIETQPPPASYDDWLATLRPAVVVLDDVDEAQSAAVNAACVRNGTPLLCGRTTGATASLALFDPTLARGCRVCAGIETWNVVPQPATLQPLAAAMLASLQAAEAVKLALDRRSALLGHGLAVDITDATIAARPFAGDQTCEICRAESRS